jgi:hypothetical protein
MSSGSCLTSKLYDKIIKMPSKSHETIPLNLVDTFTFDLSKYYKKNSKRESHIILLSANSLKRKDNESAVYSVKFPLQSRPGM